MSESMKSIGLVLGLSIFGASAVSAAALSAGQEAQQLPVAEATSAPAEEAVGDAEAAEAVSKAAEDAVEAAEAAVEAAAQAEAAKPECELRVFPTLEGEAQTTGWLSGFGIVGAIADAAFE